LSTGFRVLGVVAQERIRNFLLVVADALVDDVPDGPEVEPIHGVGGTITRHLDGQQPGSAAGCILPGRLGVPVGVGYRSVVVASDQSTDRGGTGDDGSLVGADSRLRGLFFLVLGVVVGRPGRFRWAARVFGMLGRTPPRSVSVVIVVLVVVLAFVVIVAFVVFGSDGPGVGGVARLVFAFVVRLVFAFVVEDSEGFATSAGTPGDGAGGVAPLDRPIVVTDETTHYGVRWGVHVPGRVRVFHDAVTSLVADESPVIAFAAGRGHGPGGIRERHDTVADADESADVGAVARDVPRRTRPSYVTVAVPDEATDVVAGTANVAARAPVGDLTTVESDQPTDVAVGTGGVAGRIRVDDRPAGPERAEQAPDVVASSHVDR